MHPAAEVLTVALKLGLTSFGGPSAHLGYFRAEYVERRRWLDDASFAEVVAVAQFLPGPTSSQVGATVGYLRAGPAGALAAWLGFTLPSAVALAVFAGLIATVDVGDTAWLRALKLVAVAVVLDAVLAMARTLTRTRLTVVLAAATAAAVLLLPRTGLAQLGCLAATGVAGLLLAPRADTGAVPALAVRIGRRTGALLLAGLAVLTAVATTLPALAPSPLARLAGAAYGAGALVFGGGHVVLPLLRAGTVPGLLDEETFLAGYGAAQAVPGPLFTMAAYLGQTVAGLPGALVATVAIFAPGMLLLFGVLPFWTAVRGRPAVRAALVGVDAGVVGLLAATLADPVATSAIHGVTDLVFAAALFAVLRFTRARPPAVVALALLASPLLSLG